MVELCQFICEFCDSISEFKRHALYDITMRRKKSDGEMMQEAIDKASKLIELLQKENRDLKKRLEQFEREN
jgi:hypothetical protein